MEPCNHENSIPTVRTIANGSVIVFLQCQVCGGGRSVKKADYDLSKLVPYDQSIVDRYSERCRQFYENRRKEWEEAETIRDAAWWAKYNEYLQSGAWSVVRNAVLRRDRMCQRCFRLAATQAHHLSYKTYNKHGFTFPHECVGVCGFCHDKIHPVDV